MTDKRALVCEDDAAIRMLVKTVLQREGFAVDLASNGKEGIERLDQDCYQVVVLDLMMPDVDGYQVAEHLRDRKPASLKRVIVMTAASGAIRGEFPTPICTLLPKPFNIDALTAAVRNCAQACAEQ